MTCPAIMNLPCKPYDGTDAYTHYCRGHRDARHAAAELVAAASASRDAEVQRLREALQGMSELLRSICLMKGWDWNDYAECNKARAALQEQQQ